MLTPRYYQTAANAAVWSYLSAHAGNPLVVLPTGAGKSLVIALLIEQALAFQGRVIVLQHRKELIEQNSEELKKHTGLSVGIYSAGLKSRNTSADILLAGIQSIFRKALDVGERHLVVVDEAHLVSAQDETMYGQFLKELSLANPRMRVVGLTATPFRTGEGPLCGRSKLFQKIVYEAFTGELISQGFLCPITNKAALSSADTSNIPTRGGEFIESDMQRVFEGNVESAVREIVEKTADRKSILVFCAGVAHAEQVTQCLEGYGFRVGLVTGDTLPIERSDTLRDFKSGDLRWLVNCDVLTTGFNAKRVDCIAVLRATLSPGLFAQIVGRGLRQHESKSNCLILDFGENIKRHGSIDDPEYGRSSEAHRGKLARTASLNGRGKPCPNCNQDVPVNTRQCDDCGFVFPVNHEGTADGSSTLTGQEPPQQWVVVSCGWTKHTKRGDPDAPPTLRVDYECQPLEGSLVSTRISEWICVEHEGFARTKAGLWWKVRSHSECPETVVEALSLLSRGALRMASHLTTVKDGKYTRIKSAEFSDPRPEEWDEPQEVHAFEGFGEEEAPF